MGNGNGRLRGAIAVNGHRSRKERSAGEVRGIEKRTTKAIVAAERETAGTR